MVKTCLAENLIPRGLTVNEFAAVLQEDRLFRMQWNGILRDCSRRLIEYVIEHYEKQHAQNVVEIAETYTLNENELWTEKGKDQLVQEIKTIIDKKKRKT